jgi:hypothetical protein
LRIQVEIMHARLVQDHMRELGQFVFGILNPAASDDVGSPDVVGLPERRLVDPIGFFQYALAEAERLEHLHRAASDAVSLAHDQSTGFLIDYPGPDLRKRRQLRRQSQTRRPTADDQNVDFLRKRIRALRFGRLRDFRIAGSEPVEMESWPVSALFAPIPRLNMAAASSPSAPWRPRPTTKDRRQSERKRARVAFHFRRSVRPCLIRISKIGPTDSELDTTTIPISDNIPCQAVAACAPDGRPPE